MPHIARPSIGQHHLLDRAAAAFGLDEVDDAVVRQARDAGAVGRRGAALRRIVARAALVVAGGVDAVGGHQLAGGEVDQPHLDALLEDLAQRGIGVSLPGSTRPAASSTFFCMYWRALASCVGASATAATATISAQTTHTAVAKSTV